MLMQPDTRHYQWLLRRGITDSVIEQFGLYIGDHGTMKHAIVIPVHDVSGNLVFNKYRRDPIDDRKPKYIYDKGGKVTLYGAFAAKNSPNVLITEGELDALVAWSAKIPAVSSTGGALSFQKTWISDFFAGKSITVCFDNDMTGGKGMAKIWSMMPDARFVFLPDAPNIKDLSDYVSAGGSVQDILSTAMAFPTYESILEDRARRIALFKSTFFHDAVMELMETPEPEYVSSEMRTKAKDAVVSAKSYPIPRIIPIPKTKKILCIFHEERTPSMHYFSDTNSLYCFGCGKHADAIDVYRHVYNVGFSEAVKKLNTLYDA